MPPDDAHPSLALGTHQAPGDEPTRVDSPQARARPPAPKPTQPPPIPRDDPEGRIGTTLGNYRVTDLLGKGGMGCVYRAEHIKLGREVALKMLRADYAKRRDAVSRFTQEARTVNRVRHRNIVDVPDILELEDGTTCIVMELLHGESLGKWARTGIALPRALAVLVQICDGLAAAHAVGVIHRDLKPDNVIVVPTPDGAELVKLLDFGVAKLLNRDDEDVGFQTAAGSVIGTPAYMAPEQAGGMAVDARSDIYSLGAIMYELFCGTPMFRGRSFGEYVRKHLTEQPVPPRMTDAGRHLDERIEAVILRAIEKEPARRYPTVAEMRDALLQILGAMETHAPMPVAMTTTQQSGQYPPPLPTPPPGPGMVVAFGPPSGLISSSGAAPSTTKWAWIAVGTAVVAIGIGAIAWYAGQDPIADATTHPTAAPTPPPAPPEPPPVEIAPAVAAPAPQVELRFDSLPSAGVYADGRSSELCRTPCSFNVDLTDGGPKDRRAFVVRTAGYKDARVDVDLTSARRVYAVTLEQLVPPKPVVVDVKPAKPDKPERPSRRRPSHRSTKPATTAPDEPTPKTNEKIDRSYTRDPFKKDS